MLCFECKKLLSGDFVVEDRSTLGSQGYQVNVCIPCWAAWSDMSVAEYEVQVAEQIKVLSGCVSGSAVGSGRVSGVTPV